MYKVKRKKLQIICIFIFILSVIYIGDYFYNTHKEKQENSKIQDIMNDIELNDNAITEEKTERILQLGELQKENADIIGWIEIPGTRINYPVLQTINNDFYLAHNYKKEYAESGSIFLDKDFNMQSPSTNYLIYGHRNMQGSMFEDLINYKEEKYYREHPNIKFTTMLNDSEYEIIAVFLSRVYYKSEVDVFRYYYFINASNREEFDNYILNSKNASLYDTGKTALYGDQLLTLSTCENSQEDGRLAVVAKMIEKKQSPSH